MLIERLGPPEKFEDCIFEVLHHEDCCRAPEGLVGAPQANIFKTAASSRTDLNSWKLGGTARVEAERR